MAPQYVVGSPSQDGELFVPLRRILNPTGFGESSAISANSNALGKAMNRRATVRVLVAKGQQK